MVMGHYQNNNLFLSTLSQIKFICTHHFTVLFLNLFLILFHDSIKFSFSSPFLLLHIKNRLKSFRKIGARFFDTINTFHFWGIGKMLNNNFDQNLDLKISFHWQNNKVLKIVDMIPWVMTEWGYLLNIAVISLADSLNY